MLKRFFFLLSLAAALVGTVNTARAYDPIPGCLPCVDSGDSRG